jgi:hypothetical protein
MSKVITFDKGSKRRIKEIRWKIHEVFSFVLLTIFVLVMSVFVALWEVHREHPYSEPTKVPQVREAQPTLP